MGCGCLPPPSEKMRVHVERTVWDGSSYGRTRNADELDENRRVSLPVCPGYCTKLPEVVEATWAHEYWKNGELTQFCEGQSTAKLRSAIHEYAIELSRMESWAAKNPAPEKK